MADEERIDSYVHRPSIEDDTKFLTDQLKTVLELFEKTKAAMGTLGGATTLKGTTEAAKEVQKAMDNLKTGKEKLINVDIEAIRTIKEQVKSMKDLSAGHQELVTQSVKNEIAGKALRDARAHLNAAYKEERITLEQLQEGLEEIKVAEVELKLSNEQLSRALKNLEKDSQGAEGSLDKLRAQLNLSLQAFDALSAEEKSSDTGVALKHKIDQLTESVSKEEQATGRFQRSVGNYSSATKVLDKGLQDIRKKLDDYSKSGNQNAEVLEQLRKEEELLVTLLENQATGFASVTAEIKSNTVALQQMAAAGLEGTEAYNALFAEIARLKDEAADLKAALNNAAPDDVIFNAAADAAKGLIGVYGLAQSASALFGNENKELQETLVKLQAAETALQSIEAIRAVFKKENAIMQARTVLLQKIEVAQTYLQTAAESKNIVVKYAAIAAQRVLNFVTSAAGGPILILIGLLAAAAVSMAAYGDGAEDAAASNERLSKSLERTNDALSKGSDAIKKRGDKVIAQLESDFANEADLRKQHEKNLQDDVDNIKRINDTDIKNREKAQKLVEKLQQQKFKGGGFDEEEQAKLDKAIENRDAFLDNLTKQTDKENELEILRLNNAKAAIEQEAKERQEAIEIGKVELSNRARVQADIVANDENSYEKRLGALKEFTRLQVAIQRADLKKQLDDPNLKNDPTKRALIEANAQSAITQAQRDGEKQRVALLKERAERRRIALQAILKNELEDQAKAQDSIANNENKSFDERTDALYAAYEKRRAAIIAQYQFETENTKLTAEERRAIEVKYLSDINQLTVDYGVSQLQIYKANDEKIAAEIEKESQKRLDQIATQQSAELLKLNEKRRDGFIGIEKYEKERAKIESKYRLESLQQEVNAATAKVLTAKLGTAERATAEKDLKDKTLSYSDELLKYDQLVNESRVLGAQRAAEQIQEISGRLFDIIGGFISASAERQKNAIQEQINDIDKKKEKEIEAVNASALTKQEKVNEIAIVEARAAANKENLERRQRQLDLQRARFEKIANIARIAIESALAVVHQLGSGDPYTAIPRAIAVGAIGAAELAVAIATPLPKFKTGRQSGPATLGVTGDGGKREVVTSPDLSQAYVTPNTDTLTYLPKDWKVFPDIDAFQNAAMNMVHKPLPALPVISQGNNNSNAGVITEIRELKQVIKNKPVAHITGNHAGVMGVLQYGSTWIEYVDKNVNF